MIKKIINFFLLLSFFFLSVRQAVACNELVSTVNNSSVTVRGSSCQPNENSLYLVQILKNGSLYDNLEDTVTTNSDGNFSYPFHILEEGDYEAILFNKRTGAIIARDSFSITTVRELKCGDSCNPNDTRCPDNCSSVKIDGEWRCYF